jgi:hypothetical protein
MKKIWIFFVCSVLVFSACKKDSTEALRVEPLPDQTEQNKLKINQIQLLGSHNSYHIRMDAALLSFLKNLSAILPADLDPTGLDYTHETIEDQLDKYNIRSFEIDIYNDPEGGRFSQRKGNLLIGKSEFSFIPELREPGLKVMHIPDIDFETHCITFKGFLNQLKSWSAKNPNHVPIVVLIEPKTQTVGDVLGPLGFAKAIPFGKPEMDNIDAEIKAVYGDDLKGVITPDMVKGTYATLEEAVLAGNWPTLGESRGKVIFQMIGRFQEVYAEGYPSLSGRVIFASFRPGRPEAAFTQFEGMPGDENAAKEAVAKGYIVRTRSDSPDNENRTGDYSRWNASLASGSQVISTDYYRPDPRYKTDPSFKDYTVAFPGNVVARINPVSAPDKVGLSPIREK